MAQAEASGAKLKSAGN